MGTLTVREFIDERYWPVVSPGWCAAWQLRNSYLLKIIKDEFGEMPFNEVPTERIDAFWTKLKKRYKTTITPNKVIGSGRHVWKMGIRWKYTVENPFADVELGKEKVPTFMPLTDEQHELLYAEATENLKPYLLWARFTGARRSSLAKLEERDVKVWQTRETNGTHAKHCEITFRETKNGNDYTIPGHPRLIEWLEEPGRLVGEPNRRLLPQYKELHTISSMFRRLKARLGMKGFRFHDYRHNVGSKLAEAGYDVKTRMELLGHKDHRMALRYTHIAKDVLASALREAL